jgi:hypothetical protein
MSVSGASSWQKWPAFSSSTIGPLGKAARKCVRGIFGGMARSCIPSASIAGFDLIVSASRAPPVSNFALASAKSSGNSIAAAQSALL